MTLYISIFSINEQIYIYILIFSAPIVAALYSRCGRTRVFLLVGATLESGAMFLMPFVTTNLVVFILFAFEGRLSKKLCAMEKMTLWNRLFMTQKVKLR